MSGMQAWITSAVEEKDVYKALLLACSLRRVFTAKKLAVMTTFAVLETSGEKLTKAFDLVIPINGKIPNGLDLKDHAKVDAFSLVVFNKCVYLSPYTMVLRNCDEIFENYAKFAARENGNDKIDSSVYLFKPSLDYGMALSKIANSTYKNISSNKKTDGFDKCLDLFVKNNIADWERLSEEYNGHIDLEWGNTKSLGLTVTVANFGNGLHPLDFVLGEADGKQHRWGPMEKFAVELCQTIHFEEMGGKATLYPSVPSHSLEIYQTEPIAIVGMSFRLPGGNNVDDFWDLLVNGKDAIKLVPESRWTRDQTTSPCQNRKVEAGFLSLPLDEFDSKFFGISGPDAEVMDPQQRLLLEVAWEALEDGMIDTGSIRGSKTGVFVGSWLQDYRDMVLGCTDLDFFRYYMGNSIGAGAARISHFLETTGPSIGTESGCSSAMVAVDMACKSLRNHESNLALACGVNLLLKPFDYNTISYILSPDGRCKTFDEGANGFARAEGCAVLIMKRLSDATRDGDNIWGLVRGSVITQEGVSKSFGTPTVHCESLAMELALKDAGVDPVDVSYVEAHGTGTPVGDPMEIAAITKAYSKGRSEPLVIGSVKTNVGHTESVSGITGIIKVLLSMKNQKIPRHLNLEKLNPAINLDAIPALIPLEAIAWPKEDGRPRLAGVSSFGITGTDGHVIIQDPPVNIRPQLNENLSRPLHIMKISAKSQESLEMLLTTYENLFSERETEMDGFEDVAYTANIGRTLFNHRAVIIAKDFIDAKTILKTNSMKRSSVHSSGSKLCFLFTGQGSQYPNMGETLYNTSPIFRDEFDKCDAILTKRYGISLRDALWGISSGGAELSRTLYSQTSIFCIEYCLLKLWESWGVKPDYVMGHSLGEFAAAVAAGALNFEDALMLVAERSRLIDSLPRGKMLVIQADKKTAEQIIAKYKQLNSNFWADYAALNSSDQTVVAGDSEMIEKFAKFCGDNSLRITVLAATHAFHSRHMEPMLKEFHKIAKTVKPPITNADSPKYISGMEGKLIELTSIDSDYWVRHTREPVNYIDACSVIQSEGCHLFLELGPHPVLSALTMMNSPGPSTTCLPSIRKKEDEWVTMLDSLAKLTLSEWKGQVDWKGFDRYYKRSRVSLPFYPFNRKPTWKKLEGELPTVHPLLGKPISAKCDHTIFESKLTLKNTSFIQDHVIGSTVVFPGAGFLEMCLAGGYASAEVSSSSTDIRKPQRPIHLRSLKILSPLAFYDSVICRLQTTVKLDVDAKDEVVYSVGVHRYVPSTGDGIGEWVTHSTGSYLLVPVTLTKDKSLVSNIDIKAIQAFWKKSDYKEFYEKLPEVGLRFGPQFQSLGMGWKSEEGMLLSVIVPEDNHDSYLIHPVVADAMIQGSMMWTNKDKTGKMKLQVPVQIGEFTWYQASKCEGRSRYIYCSTDESGKTDIILLDAQGTRLAYMTEVEFMETSAKVVEGMIQQQETAMPKLWREIWKSDPGAGESAYDLRIMENLPFLQFNDQQKKVLAEGNDIGEFERSFYQNLCNLANLFFLKAMYELGWKPKLRQEFTLVELVTLLPKPREHFKKYVNFFLRTLINSGMLVADSDEVTSFHFVGQPLTPNEIELGLQKVISLDDRSRVDYQLVVEMGKNLGKIWLGQVEPLEILFPNDPSKVDAGQFYNAMARWNLPILKQVNDVMFTEGIDKCTTSSTPVLRVLEVGAGTGVFSEMFLTYLEGWGKPFEFHYTDISASFFNAAEKRFEKYLKHTVFKKLNMEEDPLEQGFCPEYFDIILACETLHIAKNVRKSLEYLRCLMKPGGIFQITETTQQDPRITQMFGPLEGYWQFEDLEYRPNHVTLTPEKWEQVLTEIGCDRVVCAPVYNNVHSIITARLSSRVTPTAPLEGPSQNTWLIFYHGSHLNEVELIREKFNRVKREVHLVRRPSMCQEDSIRDLMRSIFYEAKKTSPKVEGVIYLWGLPDGSSSRDQSQVSLPLINLVHELFDFKVTPRLYVVTQGVANIDGSEITDPTAATLHGIIKALTNESFDLQIKCLDLSPDIPVINQVDSLFYDFWETGKNSRYIAFRDDRRLCAKFVSTKICNNELLALPSGNDRFQLQLPTTRLISDLEFVSMETYVLEENEIEVQVKAVGLNFRDVFAVLKPITAFDELNSVGLDFAGVVTKVGSKVTKIKVGDRVIGMNMDKNLSLPSHIRTEEDLVVSLPRNFTFVEGATLPAVFATAVVFLVNIAKMKRGETVLIHTASGGVGLCAIQLAQRLGVDIVATAGSKRKHNYLRNLGIKHVFHSRTTDFAKQILEATNGRGVDIVLNSLTGEGFKEASLSALAKNGRFMEMSKLNVWTPEEVKELRPDVFYQTADLSALPRSEMKILLEQLMKYLDEDLISPIPYESFDVVNIKGALSHLQKAKHIGKIICMMPEVKIENSKITATTLLFDEFSTYLITGGLGGIGFEVVKWMLSSGAKHVAIVSRSPPKPEIANQIESWNKNGKHVEAFSVDIGDLGQCRQLFQVLKAPSSGFPQLRGVMHAAGVLSDAIMENQTWEKFSHCYNPKVNGTWNLHDLTKDLLLEHFVVFSSIAASIGSPGQANHAASNSFEDAMVAYRRSCGLPGTSVNWGNWGEVGIATEIDFPGVRPLTTSQGILALETLLKTQDSNLAVANFDSFALAVKIFPNLKFYLDDKRLFGETKASVIINSDEFWKDVNNAEDRQGKLLVFKDFIKSILGNILKMDQYEVIDDLADFQTLGVDSLMMIEMKNGLQNILSSRISLSANQLKDCNNIQSLAERLVNILEGGEDEAESKPVLPTMKELQELILEDSLLPEHIRPTNGMVAQSVSDIETILLTGATGVLGPYILRELSHRPSIKKVICLVRKTGSASPSEKLSKRLKDINIAGEVDMSKVECIEGDMTDDRFGLSEEIYNSLAEDVDAVINSAVRADHTAKYFKALGTKKLDIRNVNVFGTVSILEFVVAKKLKYIYHASTMLSVTTTDNYEEDDAGDEDDCYDMENGKECISEGWQEDVDVLDQLPYNLGYPLSKFVSDQLCRQAVERGIPCKAFRLPVIGGDSKTGRCDYRTNHVILRWLTYLKLNCMPDVPTPMVVIPVDECARISLNVFFNSEAPHDVYNVIHPGGSVDQIMTKIAKKMGIPLKLVSMHEFIDKLKEVGDDSPLAPFMKLYREDEQELFEIMEHNMTAKALMKSVEDNRDFLRSRKLAKLLEDYNELKSTEMVMRRDIHYLKEVGVFEKFGILYCET